MRIRSTALILALALSMPAFAQKTFTIAVAEGKSPGTAEKELERREGSVVLLEAGGEYPNGARTLEIAAIARAKIRTHLPIVVDVPTIAQRARYKTAVACAAVAAGSDGVILRV